MKIPPFPAVVSTVVALAFLLGQIMAQTDSEPCENAAEAEHGVPEGAPGFFAQVSITEETFSLPIGEADHLLHDLPSDALRYARLRDLLASHTARLERLTVLRTKSGQRAVVESTNELRYATAFRPLPEPETNADEKPAKPAPKTPAAPANAAENGGLPVAFQTRNVGDTLELEPIVGPDNRTIDLNLVTQSVRYVGERAEGGPHAVKSPIFETAKVTTSVAMRAGQPYFLGTLNPPFGNGLAREQKEQRVWLDFVTADLIRLENDDAPSAKAVAILAKAQGLVIAKLEFREATVAEAVNFLRTKSVELDPLKKGVNFVLKAPARLAQVRVTLNLTDVPLLEAARSVANLAALVVEPGEYSLILRPAGEAP